MRRDIETVVVVGRSLECPVFLHGISVLAHQAAIAAQGKAKLVPDMRKHQHVFALALTGWPFLHFPLIPKHTGLFPQRGDFALAIGLSNTGGVVTVVSAVWECVPPRCVMGPISGCIRSNDEMQWCVSGNRSRHPYCGGKDERIGYFSLL